MRSSRTRTCRRYPHWMTLQISMSVFSTYREVEKTDMATSIAQLARAFVECAMEALDAD